VQQPDKADHPPLSLPRSLARVVAAAVVIEVNFRLEISVIGFLARLVSGIDRGVGGRGGCVALLMVGWEGAEKACGR